MIANDRSTRSILLFWFPLALQWLMMALEGPFLAAVIARLADPTFNLAAYGVAFAFAILVEAPVIMLMSASTALVDNAASYRQLRAFAAGLNIFSTLLLLLVLVPPLYHLLMLTVLGLPEPVADLVYGSLWILLPWPAAIGYRRFLHGVLIRSGRTRLVALGTALRLAGMSAAALVLAPMGLPGAWVGAAALSTGVVIEAVAARIMAAGAVRELIGRTDPERPGAGAAATAHREPPLAGVRSGGRVLLPLAAGADFEPTGAAEAMVKRADAAAGGGIVEPRPGTGPGYRAILQFYYPLALTSFIGLAVYPLLTFFMGRSPAPIESLAIFPVVHSLYFFFSALGLSYQEAAIALLGRQGEFAREIARFAAGLALFASAGLALIAFTPLAGVWFRTVAGLPEGLAELAVAPTRVLVLLPALGVVLAYQRAVLVQRRTTRPITYATVIEIAGIAALFPIFGWGIGLMGVVAAMVALLGGRASSVAFLAATTARTPGSA